jgi:hypothetical protein
VIRTRIVIAALALGAAAAGAEPAPASVTPTKGKPLPAVFVESETIEGISLIDDPKSAAPVHTKFNAGEYTVEYKATTNPDLLRGESFEKVHDADKAMASYAAAAATARYEWERQAGYLGVARNAELAKKYDDGIKALEGFEKDYPKALTIKDAVYQHGRLQALKGDKDAAVKTLEGLRGHDKDWGVSASVLGAIGIGDVLAGDGKAKDAAAELAPYFAKLDPTAQAEDFARAGIALAGYQVKSGDAAGMDTLRKVAFAPCGEDDQARAHLAWGKALADKGDPASTLGAFDHAAIAAALHGADAATRGDALRLANSLVPKIAATGADDNAKNKLTIEYKGYVAKLQ